MSVLSGDPDPKDPEPGGPVPPYDGRKESGEVDDDSGTTERDGVNVGGASGPVADDTMKSADPAKTPGGKTGGPGDGAPDTQPQADYEADPGVEPGDAG